MEIKNKKGVSEIVSYVLLIIIAITLSVLVYGFLKLYVPKEKPECKEGINLIIENAQCIYDTKSLTVRLQNRGLFKLDRAFIRIGKIDKKFRQDIGANPYTLFTIQGGNIIEGLNPGEIFMTNPSLTLPTVVNQPGDYVLEVQPAYTTKRGDKESLALCPPINQVISCAGAS